MAMPPEDDPTRSMPPAGTGGDPDATRRVEPSAVDPDDQVTRVVRGGPSEEPTRVVPSDATRRLDPPTTAVPAGGGPDDPRRPRAAGPPPGGPGGSGSQWLWALGILVVIGVLVAILLANRGDDDPDPAVDTSTTAVPTTEAPAEETSPTTEADEEETTTTPEAEEETTTTTESTASDPGGAGTLETTDGRTLLPVPEDQNLAGFAGQDVAGDSVLVHSVVAGEGIWLGTDEENRVFAAVTDELTTEDLTSGSRVHLTGIVEPNGGDGPQLDDDEGASLLDQQGHHLVVSALEVA